MTDANGYPTEEELQKIKDWDWKDLPGLFDFIQSIWYWGDDMFFFKDGYWEAHTGGWSGNESIIMALESNVMFWNLCWEESTRGGHYKFKLPEIKGDTQNEGTSSL